jgi:hypothetical protein
MMSTATDDDTYDGNRRRRNKSNRQDRDRDDTRIVLWS